MNRTLVFLVFACLAVTAQDVLNNESIVKMVRAGLGEGVIVSMIQSQPGKYSLTADDMVSLKGQGVPDKVLAAMVTRNSAIPTADSTAVPTPPDTSAISDLPKGLEIGVYYKKAGRWEEMLPEVVNWKTGGVIKSVATVGVVKGDINGHIPGGASRNTLHSPIEVVIYAPEGVAITEYQLLHLHEKSNAREFRTVTGGVMHVSGGATRDVLPFEGKKVASRIYKVSLTSLGAGEYGFLPPGADFSKNSASIGKMYTFHLVE
jgi:hypothetical protein